MAAADIIAHSAHDSAAAVRERRLTAAQVTDAFLDRIQRLDGPLHAFLTVAEERSRLSAARVDEVVRTIVETARTGRQGDGKILVLPAGIPGV